MKIIENNKETILHFIDLEAPCHSSGCTQCDDCVDGCDCSDACDLCPPNN